jgi:hypothetical protein
MGSAGIAENGPSRMQGGVFCGAGAVGNLFGALVCACIGAARRGEMTQVWRIVPLAVGSVGAPGAGVWTRTVASELVEVTQHGRRWHGRCNVYVNRRERHMAAFIGASRRVLVMSAPSAANEA